MPKGPQGQKRPADVVGNAVRIMRIATGQEEETPPSRKSGAASGGRARADKLPAEARKEIAQKAAKARWKNK